MSVVGPIVLRLNCWIIGILLQCQVSQVGGINLLVGRPNNLILKLPVKIKDDDFKSEMLFSKENL